jgi:hypothetical protein
MIYYIYQHYILILFIFYFYKHMWELFITLLNIEDKFVKIVNIIEFIHENNPLLLSYYEDDFEEKEKEKLEETTETMETMETMETKEKEEKYENKYLAKFKTFADEYLFVNEDYEYKNKIVDEIICQIKKDIERQKVFLNKLNSMKEKILEGIKNKLNSNIQKEEKEEEDDNSNSDSDSDDEEDLNETLIKIENTISLENNLLNKKIESLTPEELEKTSHNMMIENKLNKLINNYIIECTPLGNVSMRYNNDKKSFEYYSNNTIPFRFLEVIGRKYVMTYGCKYLFVDMDSEIKKVTELNKIELNDKKNKKKPVPRLDMFSINKGLVSKQAPKNNQSIVNPINNIDISIKESNRYTWQGRFSDFKIIKSEKKSVSNISFKEFKQKNKL